MGYRFCFGASGAGKSRFLHSMILEEADPSRRSETGLHDNYVIIVPDQYSMQTQKEIVEESESKGIMNIDVLSFGRLTYRIFEETGVSGRAVLDEVGKTLMIRRTAGRCEQDLRILNKSIHYPGMINEIKSVISEFMQYGIGEKELSSMQQYAGDHDTSLPRRNWIFWLRRSPLRSWSAGVSLSWTDLRDSRLSSTE